MADMKYEMIVDYSNTKFRQITEVERATLHNMAYILQGAYAEKYRCRGRTPNLREYQTYAHIAASYGIAESNIYR